MDDGRRCSSIIMRGQDGHGKDQDQQQQGKATHRKLLERERERSWNIGGWREEDGDVNGGPRKLVEPGHT